MNRSIALPCLLLAALVAVSACQRQDATPAAPKPAGPTATARVPAPEAKPAAPGGPAVLRVQTIDGKTFDLDAHRGHWVVVNFWATWCGPCLKEMPDLSALDAMRDHVDVVGLAYEDTTPAQLQAFLRTHPVVYPVAIVDVYKPPASFDTPRGLPTTYLVAPDGRIAKHFLGPVTAGDIDAAILAAGGPKPAA